MSRLPHYYIRRSLETIMCKTNQSEAMNIPEAPRERYPMQIHLQHRALLQISLHSHMEPQAIPRTIEDFLDFMLGYSANR